MAFPVVAASAETSQSTNVTSHPMTMPAGITAGELLLCFFANDGSATVTWPGDWVPWFSTPSGTAARLSGAYKWAAGGDTLTVTTSVGENSAGWVVRITGAHATTPPEVGVQNNNVTAVPNLPLFDPAGWAIEDTLWFGVVGCDGAGTISAASSDFTAVGDGYARGTGTAANSAWCGLYQRNEASASKDPQNWTISAVEDWVATTVAVRPAAVVTKAVAASVDAVADVAAEVRHMHAFTESFNKADGATLGPDLTWERPVRFDTLPHMAIVSNQVRFVISEAPGMDEGQWPVQGHGSPNQAVEVDVTLLDRTGTGPYWVGAGHLVRATWLNGGADYKAYACEVNHNDTIFPGVVLGYLLIWRIDTTLTAPDDAVVLASVGFPLADLTLPGRVLLQAIGTDLKARFTNASGKVFEVNTTDATMTGGRIGLGLGHTTDGGSVCTADVDNFRAIYFDARPLSATIDAVADIAATVTKTGAAVTVTGTGTGSVSIGGTASGRGVVAGVGVGAVSVAGLALGRGVMTGVAAGAVNVAGVAVGRQLVTAVAAGAVSIGGQASGQQVVRATAVGAVSVAGLATGRQVYKATGAGTVSIAGSAAGRQQVTGAGAGAVSVAGLATGRQVYKATGTGTVAVTGMATGGQPALGGQAVGVVEIAGVASGRAITRGLGAGSVAVTGLATGRGVVQGTGTGSVAVSGLVAGRAVTVALGVGVVRIDGLASGRQVVKATGAGSVAIVGLGAGASPGRGLGVGVVRIDGHATGGQSTGGTGAGVVAVVGMASGRQVVTGSAQGVVWLSGEAHGKPAGVGTAAGLVALAGVATAEVRAYGTGLGLVVILLTAQGFQGEPAGFEGEHIGTAGAGASAHLGTWRESTAPTWREPNVEEAWPCSRTYQLTP